MPRRILAARLSLRGNDLRKKAALLPEGKQKQHLLASAEQCQIAADINIAAFIENEFSLHPSGFRFGVEEAGAGNWVIRAYRQNADPITLLGTYITQKAAIERLADVSKAWLLSRKVSANQS